MANKGRSCLAVVLLLAGSAHAADDVHLWMRGFILDSVVVDSAEATTRGVVKASDGGCFSTDQRGWSDEAGASSRLSSDFHLVIPDSGVPVVRPSQQRVHSAGAIHQVDCQTAQELAVSPTQLLASVVGTPAQTDAKTQIHILAAVPDPQRPWSSSTISYDATFTYDRATKTLDYVATTGLFPAYEAYAALNDGSVVTVLRSGPLRRNESTEAATVELKGSINLSGKRPMAPTNFTVQ